MQLVNCVSHVSFIFQSESCYQIWHDMYSVTKILLASLPTENVGKSDSGLSVAQKIKLQKINQQHEQQLKQTIPKLTGYFSAQHKDTTTKMPAIKHMRDQPIGRVGALHLSYSKFDWGKYCKLLP